MTRVMGRGRPAESVITSRCLWSLTVAVVFGRKKRRKPELRPICVYQISLRSFSSPLFPLRLFGSEPELGRAMGLANAPSTPTKKTCLLLHPLFFASCHFAVTLGV